MRLADRSAYHQYKDASDIAVAIEWYAESPVIEDHLYETTAGNDLLVESEMDVTVASAFLLGSEVQAVLGPERRAELAARWPGEQEGALLRDKTYPSGRRSREDLDRRRASLEDSNAGSSTERRDYRALSVLDRILARCHKRSVAPHVQALLRQRA